MVARPPLQREVKGDIFFVKRDLLADVFFLLRCLVLVERIGQVCICGEEKDGPIVRKIVFWMSIGMSLSE